LAAHTEEKHNWQHILGAKHDWQHTLGKKHDGQQILGEDMTDSTSGKQT
jgi:hypothetical protein